MTWFATAVFGSAIIGGIAANSAAQTQADASTQAAQIQQNMFNQTLANESPYVQAGYGAQNYLNFLLGIPGYNSPTGQSTASTPNYGGGGGRMGAGANGMAGGGGGFGDASYLQTTGQNGAGGPGANVTPQLQAGPSSTSSETLTGIWPSYVTAGGPNTSSSQSGAQSAPSGPGGFGSLLTPFTIDQFHKMSPAYQFQLQQGQQGVLNGDAAGSGALSGAAQKDLMSFNQNAANTAFNNAFNQYQTQQGNIYGRLAGIANQGQAAASNSATGGSSYANSIGANTANAGTALAGGIVGSANSLSSAAALPWLTNSASSGFSLNPVIAAGSAYGQPNVGNLTLPSSVYSTGP